MPVNTGVSLNYYMPTREEFIMLLEKYQVNTISAEERSLFFSAVLSGIFDDLVTERIQNELNVLDTVEANLLPHRSAEILHKILSSEKQNLSLLPKVFLQTKIFRLTAAAAILFGIICSVYVFNVRTVKTAAPIITLQTGMEVRVNKSNLPLKLKMEDGTFISLQPGAIIHYPLHFLQDKREVILDGEAFFEVSKNPNRPFFVYNKNIVTHVLGTSFNVKVNSETKQLEVAVRSGRVEVYERIDLDKSTPSNKRNGVILLPNQKVVYDENARQFIPSLVDKPQPIMIESDGKNKLPDANMVFEETPLKTVLPWLEKTYGIEIVVENESLYKCLFTGDINKQELYTRLDIVCQATGASYDVKGTKILIKGKGCN